MCLAALTIPAIHTAPAPLGRRLLQTCPDGQTWVNNACYCNPGTRDGTLVNPLMLCNGNNTLCPWRLWRGVPYRSGHVSGAFWPYQYFNLGVDDNTLSTFRATCSAAAPTEVTIDMQTSYRIASMNLWAGVTDYGAVPGVLPDSLDVINYAYTSNMDIRLGNSIFNMTTCYSSGTLLSIAATFTTAAVPITSCNNITARYINISMKGNGAGYCGFRDLRIRAYDPSTASTCQACPENNYCRLNQTYACPAGNYSYPHPEIVTACVALAVASACVASPLQSKYDTADDSAPANSGFCWECGHCSFQNNSAEVSLTSLVWVIGTGFHCLTIQ